MADAPDLGSGGRKAVEVRLLSRGPFYDKRQNISHGNRFLVYHDHGLYVVNHHVKLCPAPMKTSGLGGSSPSLATN
jgi:hypothetical protein